MTYEDYGVDELLAEDDASSGHPSAPRHRRTAQRRPADPSRKRKKKRSLSNRLSAFFGRTIFFLLLTVVLVVVSLYSVMYVLVHGPSPSARDLFVISVRETSAVGFLANLFLTEEEIAAIDPEVEEEEVGSYVEMDTSLIQIPQPTEPSGGEQSGPQPDAWGLIDEDGDGIILQDVKGEGFIGKMLVILDPSRVLMGSNPDAYGSRGYTVESMVERYDGVAGINAGGFEDLNGSGNGSEPNTLVVYEGKIYYAHKGVNMGFVGLDSNHILHVAAKITSDQIRQKDIQYGVCFGPVLVTNGEKCSFDHLVSGVNPRTAIGQRADGAILLLVIDGRQMISLGATYADLADIFIEYGAVNACNLDGGSSSVMYFNGEYINNNASVVGIRPVPTTFIVLKEGGNSNG